MTHDDPKDAYEVAPIEPGQHGPPEGWWTVKRNGIPVKHFPGKEKAERYATEAKEAMADHEDAQKAFQGNHERLRHERLAREAAAGPMLYPAPELPDDTLAGKVRFSTRVRNALNAAGMKTIGEVREASDEVLLRLPDFGKSSVAHLRQTLGPSSTDGVRPVSKRPT